ncbi:MAG: hypothetical protein PHU62_06550 [Bacteroidales bacterium]|nr:hypothetical protein [Bacteroidales bacterium]MDD2205355.1 hypothetical protein [Bacteroidales bacterium]MDD3914784.1 hypothetical protein [Bacteroidales bacterium]MDD4634211.1 hypothetical protein [Bacteroidales bacterium]
MRIFNFSVEYLYYGKLLMSAFGDTDAADLQALILFISVAKHLHHPRSVLSTDVYKTLNYNIFSLRSHRNTQHFTIRNYEEMQ